ncbi:ubiquitin carboxyl-terminal hydrolase family protein [Actinidia rufa]|uniref:Ubiquitin carboxyl-terminal hydrolase family protein n=1 Tax=Actinidia rufa TaxID=165716 RepID=A0A7J0EMQ3_9ERIC|nr:ubiquitin carboxyl-terminal hydrolase family protein [Actinidia rufa]
MRVLGSCAAQSSKTLGFCEITESSKSSGSPISLQTLKIARSGNDLEADIERSRTRRSTAIGNAAATAAVFSSRKAPTAASVSVQCGLGVGGVVEDSEDMGVLAEKGGGAAVEAELLGEAGLGLGRRRTRMRWFWIGELCLAIGCLLKVLNVSFFTMWVAIDAESGWAVSEGKTLLSCVGLETEIGG